MRTVGRGGFVLRVAAENFPLKEPFHITGHTMVSAAVVTVEIEKDGRIGRGEASGAYYRKFDDAASNVKQIEALRPRIEVGLDRNALQHLLPRGGARNALDCALWDLEAKITDRPVWQIAGLNHPQPLLTTFTVGANSPDKMAKDACAYAHAKAIKLKLTGQPVDADRVRAVREVCPEMWLGVDANQGFTRPFLEALMPVLVEARVQLIEQPFKVGQEADLEGLRSPIWIAADESIEDLADLRRLAGRFDMVNIKLDKCGGLSEALAMAREAPRLGLELMVGNMVGTSLAMAPSFLIGQLCKVVDLDGPVFLGADRASPVRYENGMTSCPRVLWGAPEPTR